MESQKVLLSFLGTGTYEPIDVRYQGQAHRSAYVQHALAAFFPQYELRVAMTPAARRANAHGLKPLTYEAVELPDDVADHSGHFAAIASAVPAGCSLIIDVTHGFRFQPLLALAAAQLLSEANGVRVVEILYLPYERGVQEAELLSLRAYMELLEWSKATAEYTGTGNASAFGSKLKAIQTSAHRAGHTELPKAFSAFGELTERLGLEVELNRVSDARKTLEKLDKRLVEVEKEILHFPLAEPMRLIWHRVRESLGRLTSAGQEGTVPVGGPGNATAMTQLQFSRNLIQEHLRFGRLVQAITLARESMVSYYAYASGRDANVKRDRDDVENELNSLRQQGAIRSQTPAAGDTALLGANPDIVLWDRVTQVRNDINHAGQGRANAASAKQAKTTIDDLCRKVVELLG